jgi:hypothetical protein
LAPFLDLLADPTTAAVFQMIPFQRGQAPSPAGSLTSVLVGYVLCAQTVYGSRIARVRFLSCFLVGPDARSDSTAVEVALTASNCADAVHAEFPLEPVGDVLDACFADLDRVGTSSVDATAQRTAERLLGNEFSTSSSAVFVSTQGAPFQGECGSSAAALDWACRSVLTHNASVYAVSSGSASEAFGDALWPGARFAGVACPSSCPTAIAMGDGVAHQDVVIGVVTAFVVFMTCLACSYWRRVSAVRRRRDAVRRLDLFLAEYQQRPARVRAEGQPQVSVASITRPFKAASMESACSICLCDVVDEKLGAELARCSHVFHVACLEDWLSHGGRICPVCRVDFLEGDVLAVNNV